METWGDIPETDDQEMVTGEPGCKLPETDTRNGPEFELELVFVVGAEVGVIGYSEYQNASVVHRESLTSAIAIKLLLRVNEIVELGLYAPYAVMETGLLATIFHTMLVDKPQLPATANLAVTT
jgi:hypothetical protein